MVNVSIPLDSALVGELYLRAGHPSTDIGSWIEDVLRDYLDRTADNGDWAEAYYSWREKAAGTEAFQTEFGDPKGGYRWGPLFMPNGTLVRMEYKRQTHQATVKFDKIDYKGESYTPSELASKIAAGTSRNAWRDLMVKRPGDTEWCMADGLRRIKRNS